MFSCNINSRLVTVLRRLGDKNVHTCSGLRPAAIKRPSLAPDCKASLAGSGGNLAWHGSFVSSGMAAPYTW